MHVFALARRVAGHDVAALSDDSWLHWSEGEGSEWSTQYLSSLPVRLDGAPRTRNLNFSHARLQGAPCFYREKW